MMMNEGKAANIFKINGVKVSSQADFISLMGCNVEIKNIIYYPNNLKAKKMGEIKFKDKIFHEISFKDTEIKNILFVECTFRRCLFLGVQINNCEFIRCNFFETNTNKIKIINTLLDPDCFNKNFNFIDDTNIAINLYQEIYSNSYKNHQEDFMYKSQYKMHYAQEMHLKSKLKRGIISKPNYLVNKIFKFSHRFLFGYGVRISIVFRTFFIIFIIFIILNYLFRYDFNNINSFVDAIYYTSVTMTTLGYGDIIPKTNFSKIMVSVQAFSGFIMLGMILSITTNHAIKVK